MIYKMTYLIKICAILFMEVKQFQISDKDCIKRYYLLTYLSLNFLVYKIRVLDN